jgi:hypothetical protein
MREAVLGLFSGNGPPLKIRIEVCPFEGDDLAGPLGSREYQA